MSFIGFFLRSKKVFGGRPDPRIESLLVGEKPPDDFEGDGCTCAPDLWFREACRYHDWAYAKLRKMDPNSQEWRSERARADVNLRRNIITLSQYSVVGGKLVEKRRGFLMNRWGYKLSRVYYKAVRRFGWAAADNRISKDK